MKLSLRLPMLACTAIIGYVSVDAKLASASFDEYFEGLGDVEGVSGFWREADNPDTYLNIQTNGTLTIYRRNGLFPDDDVTSKKDCYVDGGSTMLSRQTRDRFMYPESYGNTNYRYIDLIVRDDPDTLNVVWERSFFGDTKVLYERERGRLVAELPLCSDTSTF